MDGLSRERPWHHYAIGLLLQLLLALCCFSYLRVRRDSPTGSPRSGPSAAAAPQPLLILLWTWPFNTPVALSRCSEMRPGATDCQLTADRSAYPRAGAAIVHHQEGSAGARPAPGAAPGRYLSYFRWRDTLRPRTFSWALAFCKACWRLQEETRYLTVPSIASWFT
ncbi:alpha-(1,3)-fucosyltransferase 5 [Tupaia chinensis]|uniref:alpha-(1,3)-fucosyltransferase 5 n=1 Tax=Tupaia chinensis TaxID=246437 RepID=UPI0003C9098A|nr:alpha-(1,3)-fucosyltransferase 5 [Tupaia chinensis]